MAARAPEWRFGRGWTDDELSTRLAALVAETAGASSVDAKTGGLDRFALGFPARAERVCHVVSEGILARESAGVPEPGGPFARARDLLAKYELSDPTIVEAHFDRAAPLLGRPILLELKVLGLRYLCAVVVSDVVEEADDRETRFAFRVDTVPPHLERGSEWFILTKNHGDGLVGFSIRAVWEPGEFPNLWSRLGFRLLGRHYQHAWHRHAYRRLRDRLHGGGPAAPYPTARVQITAGAGRRRTRACAMGARPDRPSSSSLS